MYIRRDINIPVREIEESSNPRSSIELFFRSDRRLQLARLLLSMSQKEEMAAGGDKAATMDIQKDDIETWLVNNDTVDFQGRRADKSRTGGWITAPLIFGAEMCERMSAFGIIYNLVTFLVGNLHLSRAYSANMVTNMLGTSFVTCLLGGYVADTWLGRFLTISTFGVIQFLGLVLITLFASLPEFQLPHCNEPEDPCHAVHGFKLAVLYVALYLIALGTGGIKACVSAFGADQFDSHDPREKKQMMSFFNWFFFSISLGALFAVTVLVYVQEKLGRGWGFGITASFMLLAVVGFLSGRRYYRYSPIKGSPMSQIYRVFATAFRNHKLQIPADVSQLHEANPGYDRIRHSNQFLFLSKAAIKSSASNEDDKSGDLKASKDQPPNRPAITVTEVEEVKVLIRVLPILGTTFMFWTVYAQMTTFSVEQALIMDRKIGRHFEIPPASMAVFLQISIMTMIVLYDRLFVRCARHFTHKSQGITTLQRIGVGLVLSTAAMIAAALVEQKRLKVARRVGTSKGMSVFWLLPQYFLVGAGEAFTYVGQLEFFYNESPTSMRSMGTAICLCTLSFGFYFSSIFVDGVDRFTQRGSASKGWLANDPDAGHLDYFYFLLAIVSLLNFFLYLLCSHWYNYRIKQDIDDEEDDSLAAKSSDSSDF
ncbi:MFS transporter, POT/PTR family, nitrate transporter [Marchantia polymorpha subsp. ruderalis]|uniref:Uncharacterized protein n=2 Tax=Marchantia polymorpha TaxID=3197 RepID=A0AAF6B1E4_MARPO|nr:hypothetical protein MARPO_0004s0040 [Marchantia polymorpha]BBN05828.1 hypothetical protein Mp_3g16310 [Marchantia polymorpha subsp. ruderalis]PTQ48748.1 hypothetical protein MARPO_0004s0040 [Marchantia polymorpha]PTQ48752.1 hypothetical protein MARPO_0004s0040 [Marchantia polymorpha]BBN05829.1 hypothetical protein Mp_3g16310 [Marchantia polymorpha subsp. ruderalis]|eukprot:PTQ48747.1 hypothetical protein MARPO_0004s0040 [Marchantia polymorpha]